MDAVLFLVFLGRLLQITSGKLVRDRRLPAGRIDTLEVWNWLERHKERIALFYLPPYFSGREPVRVPGTMIS